MFHTWHVKLLENSPVIFSMIKQIVAKSRINVCVSLSGDLLLMLILVFHSFTTCFHVHLCYFSSIYQCLQDSHILNVINHSRIFLHFFHVTLAFQGLSFSYLTVLNWTGSKFDKNCFSGVHRQNFTRLSPVSLGDFFLPHRGFFIECPNLKYNSSICQDLEVSK